MKRMNTKVFIQRAKLIHGNKYDYSKTNYIYSYIRIKIICPEHGEFTQIPNDHLRGSGCPACKGVKKLNTKTFIQKAKEIHGDKYDYSNSVYVNNHTKINIICPIHGKFWQTPLHHIVKGCGCLNCYTMRGIKKQQRRYKIKEFRKSIIKMVLYFK